MTSIVYSSENSDGVEALVEHGKKIEREGIMKEINRLIDHTNAWRFEKDKLEESEYLDGVLYGKIEILEILKGIFEND